MQSTSKSLLDFSFQRPVSSSSSNRYIHSLIHSLFPSGYLHPRPSTWQCFSKRFYTSRRLSSHTKDQKQQEFCSGHPVRTPHTYITGRHYSFPGEILSLGAFAAQTTLSYVNGQSLSSKRAETFVSWCLGHGSGTWIRYERMRTLETSDQKARMQCAKAVISARLRCQGNKEPSTFSSLLHEPLDLRLQQRPFKTHPVQR